MIRITSVKRRSVALDWRGHGSSEHTSGDFSNMDLMEDALSVIEAKSIQTLIPVAMSHSGWVALELCKRLGERIPKVIAMDWIVLDPPLPFMGALQGLQSKDDWETIRSQLFSMWLNGSDEPRLKNQIREMGGYGYSMWARAGREISSMYARYGNPLKAFGEIKKPFLHIYSQPDDTEYVKAQQSFAEEHSWFEAVKIKGRSHFPTIELPEITADIIEEFASRP